MPEAACTFRRARLTHLSFSRFERWWLVSREKALVEMATDFFRSIFPSASMHMG